MTASTDHLRIVPFVVAAALFMEQMDSTVIATSLPAIAADLGVDPVILKLAFTAYLLSLAVFIPISGWAADRFGARTIFRAAIVVFTLGSIGCGLATSLEGLVGARVVQGLGGAMMVPVGRLVILRLVPKAGLVDALAYLTIPALLGPIVGPPLGGFITTYFHWRWIFLINVPFGILGLVLATLYIPAIREDAPAPLDLRGFVLSGVGLSSLIFGATLYGREFVAPYLPEALLGVGAAVIVAYVRHARSIANPIIDLSLFQLETFRCGVAGGFLFRIGIGSLPFLLPLLLQLEFGLTPFLSGSITFVGALGALTMKTAASRFLRRFGFRTVLIANGLVSTLLIAVMALFTPSTPYALMMALLLIGGLSRSLQFTSLNAIAFAEVEQRRMSLATSLSSVAQQLAISTGVAVAAFVLETTRSLRGETVLIREDFAVAFVVVAAIGGLATLFYLRLPPQAGEELVGARGTPAPVSKGDGAAKQPT
jgi:EmrB/QacA subfamily drug resistance transporter